MSPARSTTPPVTIRRAHSSDLPSLYRICHATGFYGGDASGHVSDPDLIGHIYAGPYAVLEPDLAFVTVLAGQIVGYVLGAADSARFHARAEVEWFPTLRERYPLPTPDDSSVTANFVRTLHRGHPPSAAVDLRSFPAHLHIDLLPQAQGQGCGRRLIEHLLEALRQRDVPGVHLFVARKNTGAVPFYERVGFRRIEEAPDVFGYARALR